MIAVGMFIGRWEHGNLKEKILMAIAALGTLIFSIATGWAVLQPGWFLEPGSFSNQIVNWGFLVWGITGLSSAIGLMKLRKMDNFQGILFSVVAIGLIAYALYKMAQ